MERGPRQADGDADGAGKVVRAWGHPAWVRGDVQLAGERALLRALDVPAQPVRRAARARPALGVHLDGRDARRPGNGLAKLTGAERADAAAYERDHDRIEHAKRHPWRYLLYVLLLGLVRALLVVLVVY